MATHSSVLAWRIPGMGEPGGLPSMGSHRVGHDWSNLAAAAALAGGFFTTSTTWEALGSISRTRIANRGRRHWLQSRNLELWWEMTSEPFRSVRYSRRMKPDGWPAQLGHLVWQVIERSHSASPGTTWQAAGQSERRARALGRVQTILHPEAGGQQPCDPLRDRRWRLRGVPLGEMRGSAAVKAGGPRGSHLPCLLCSQEVKFTVERLGGADKEKWGGKATTTWKSKSRYNMPGLK